MCTKFSSGFLHRFGEFNKLFFNSTYGLNFGEYYTNGLSQSALEQETKTEIKLKYNIIFFIILYDFNVAIVGNGRGYRKLRE
ncbi:hypothetical protein C7S20_18620 [Christiangramia fulva]|uniref:Uncharacterized protein n=1 Tax=Christiangramia fulva TaxID=2126553 RepID=A0A2R3ZA14_9FLAO|nr:hypothetical protein C7S20_18620 [Christiangramia fulva]